MKAIPMKLFLAGITLALIAVLGAAAWFLIQQNRPMLDSVGGTLLVYEVDRDVPLRDGYLPEKMAEAMRHRVDPDRRINITVHALAGNRFEVGIPRTDDHEAQVNACKEGLAQAGFLEFRILANGKDDSAVFQAAEMPGFLPAGQRNDRLKELAEAAMEGRAPRFPSAPNQGFFPTANGPRMYAWVELGKSERRSLGLHNAAEADPGPAGARSRRVAVARMSRSPIVLDDLGQTLVYSRECISEKLPQEERERKRFEHFVLTRVPLFDVEITGAMLTDVHAAVDQNERPAVAFSLNEAGGNRFWATTSANQPTGPEDKRFFRHMAIILDGMVLSAPRLTSAIRREGQITGDFTKREVEQLVQLLRSGALPATLKPLPVSEVVVEPKK